MKRWIALLLALLAVCSLCGCENKDKEKDTGSKEAELASELLSDTAWGSMVGEVLGENTYHILLFTNGGNGSGDVEWAIQFGESTSYDVRGTYTISEKGDCIIETEYEEQLKDGSWGEVDEGRIDHDTFQYVIEDGKITELYRVDEDGEQVDTFILLED